MNRKIRFPNRLLQLRTQRGLTQEYVAAVLGISARHYQRIEGQQVEPGALILQRLSKILGCGMEDIIIDH